mmetsp:Transcript_9004/g.16886  ORF Transcript_9004/g.16886 Transcript_9004/m.16886 type:complete len:208 (+) Transcript_9004:83-706(+)
MEFGQVVLLQSDGSEGQALNIRKDVSFGRDHPAHIRIKSKSVASQHAKVHIDTNGICFLRYIHSTMSRPRINGVRMSSKRQSVQLHHLDVITIAGRSFLFKSKSGLTIDAVNSQVESENMRVGYNNDSLRTPLSHADREVDSMSLDSRGSRRSTTSQMSSCSSYSVNTVGSKSSRGLEKAVAWIHLLKKDGTEGSPHAVIRELTFGS